jgi:uncharacterized protein YndB with AHSA1/START domain
MSEEAGKREERRIEKQIEIDAPPEAVWKALTTGEGLTRWFPLEASVEPGAGGKLTLSWGPEWQITSEITAWDPNRRLAWGTGKPVKMEVTIEARGGKTIVRLVQSGFSTGADWENEFYDSTDYGWVFMLANLRHYLERHAGVARAVAWPRVKAEMPRTDAYERLAGSGGIFADGAAKNLREGARYSLGTATGEAWTGEVKFVREPRGFCVTVEQLKDALAWLTIEGGKPPHDVQLWFSTYGLPAADVKALEERWSGELQRILR